MGLLLAAVLSVGSALGQEPSPDDDGLSIESLQGEIAALEKVSAEDKDGTQALGFYRAALQSLQRADENASRAADFKKTIDTAAAEEAQLAKELDGLNESSPDKESRRWAAMTPDELGQLFTKKQADQADLQNQLAELRTRASALLTRPEQIRDEVATAKTRLDELQKLLKQAQVAPGETARSSRARQSALRAEQRELVARTNKLELERLSVPVRARQQDLSRKLAEAKLSATEERVRALQELIAERRQTEAERARDAADQTRQDVAGKHPLLIREAERNTELGRRLAKLSEDLRTAQAQLQQESSLLKDLEGSYRRISQQLEFSGMERALAQVLFGLRKRLLDVRRYERKMEEQHRKLADVRLAQFDTDDQIRAVSSPDEYVDKLFSEYFTAKNGEAPVADERDRIRGELAGLLSDRQTLLGKLKDVYSGYVEVLGNVQLKQREVLAKAQAYIELLDENLWLLPSNQPIDLEWSVDLVDGIAWVSDPKSWADTVLALGRQALEHASATFVLVLAVAGLLFGRRWLKGRLVALSQNVGNVTKDSYVLTVRALIATAALATPWPLLLFGVGWLLSQQSEAFFTFALGTAMIKIAPYFWLLHALSKLFVEKGLAETHFRWTRQVLEVFSRNLAWYVPVAVALGVLVTLTHWHIDAPEVSRSTLGRLAQITGCGAFGVFVWRVLRRDAGAFTQQRGPCWGRWNLLDFVLVALVLMVGSFALLTIAGYYFTSLELFAMLYRSLLLVVGAFLLYSLALRWQLLVARRIAFANALSRRQADLEARASRQAGEAAEPPLSEAPEDRRPDLADLAAQTQKFLRIVFWVSVLLGLGWLWGDIAPAFTAIDEIVLWHYTVADASGSRLVPITAQDLLTTLVVVVLTVVASRNIPGLMEIFLLQPLGLEAGNRYAINTLARYVILTVGFLAVVQILGVGWGDVQWLIAALGVGLGFGLKDIFANFMSGLIILFERPIRVGDIVTVGAVSGVVSRIRIRSTTITDWDNKEMVIPNQSLVVQSLINWTLTDQVTRMTFQIGLAYGCDTERACRLIQETIEAHPLVMTDPKPSVFFLGFGESALTFEFRVYVRDRSHRMPVTHELHMALERKLRENGIEIPFPQRDLHIRSIDPQLGLGGLPAIDPGRRAE